MAARQVQGLGMISFVAFTLNVPCCAQYGPFIHTYIVTHSDLRIKPSS